MFDKQNPDQETVVQSDNVMCSLGHVLSVHLPNGSSTSLELLDMPLLIDLSSSKENEIFVNASVASVDDFNNNPHASLHLQTNFILTNSQQLQLNDSCQYNTSDEPLVKIHATDILPDDDISEFLIFHKKRPTDSDPKLKFGCYVKLTRLQESAIHASDAIVKTASSVIRSCTKNGSILESTDNDCAAHPLNGQSKHIETDRIAVNKRPNVASEASVRAHKRNAKNSTDALSAKKVKHNQVIPRNSSLHVNSSTKKNEHEFNNSDNGCAALPINEKRNGIADEKLKTVLKIVRDKLSNSYHCYSVYRIPEQFGIKNCSVSIQPLPTLKPIAPRNKRPHASMTRKTKREKTNSLLDDIENSVSPSSQQNLRKVTDEGRVDASNSASLSTDTNGCRPNPLENEIESIPTELSESTVTSAAEIVNNYVGDGDDDNCSISSGISLHPSGSDDWLDIEDTNRASDSPRIEDTNRASDSPRIEDTNRASDSPRIKDTNRASDSSRMEDTNRASPTNERSLKNYRIPKVSRVVQEESQERAMEIAEIFAQSVRNSPRMISPIQDLPKNQQTNPKSSATESNSRSEDCNSAERQKFGKSPSKETAESNQPEHSNGSNEQLESIVAMTTNSIGTSEPLTQKTAHKSTIDYKNFTINVANLNSTRTVSLPGVNHTVMLTNPQQPLPAAQVPCKERIPTVPVSSQLTINVGDLNSTRTAALSNANTTATVTNPQQVQSAAPGPCRQRFQLSPSQSLTVQRTPSFSNENSAVVVNHSQPALQSIINSVRMTSLSNAYSTGIVAPGPCQQRVQRFQLSANQPLTVQSGLMPRPIDSAHGNLSVSSPSPVNNRFSATMKLFEQPCLNYFEGNPCREKPCHYSHQLPNDEKVFEKMKTYPDDQIHYIYKSFILKNLATFLQYFPMICYLFGTRKMSEVLVSSIKNCNKYKRYDFYKFIFGGLLFCGISVTETLKTMADSVDLDDVCEESVAALIEIGKNPTNPFPS